MSSRLASITQQRLGKLQRLRDLGIDPYPGRYHRSHTTQDAKDLFEQGVISVVSLAGRIIAQRSMGKAIFVDMRDGSGKIQAYFRKDELGQLS